MALTLHTEGISRRYVAATQLELAITQRAVVRTATQHNLEMALSYGQPAPYEADHHGEFTVFRLLSDDVVLAKAYREDNDELTSGVIVFFERNELGRWSINSSYYSFVEVDPDKMTTLELARLYVGLHDDTEE